jgi:hypothetical protein
VARAIHRITNWQDHMTPTYLPNADYNQLVAAALVNPALLDVPCSPITGYPTENEVKIVLGEDWNIWPASILSDVA